LLFLTLTQGIPPNLEVLLVPWVGSEITEIFSSDITVVLMLAIELRFGKILDLG
jgi:hypothetical protein